MTSATAATAPATTPLVYHQYPQVQQYPQVLPQQVQQYTVYQQYPQVPQQYQEHYYQQLAQPAPQYVPEQLQFVPEQLQYYHYQYPQYQYPYYQYPHFTGGYNCEIQYVSPFIVSKSNSPYSQGSPLSLVSSSQPPQQQDASQAQQASPTGLVVSM